MPSPQWSFSLFPGRVARCAFRGAVGRRKRQPFPLPKRATCASGGSMDGRRFGRAPKSASFSRGGRPEMAGLMSEAALWLLDYARCTRNRPLGRAFPVRIVNGFHPPKVQKHKPLPIPPHTLLRENRARARTVDPDDQCHNQHQRPEDQQRDQRQYDVLRTPAEPVQPLRVQHVASVDLRLSLRRQVRHRLPFPLDGVLLLAALPAGFHTFLPHPCCSDGSYPPRVHTGRGICISISVGKRMPSPQWSFSLFPGRVARCAFRGAVGRRKRQPFPLPKRA